MTAFAASPAPNDSVVVRPQGRLNLAVAPVLRQQLVDLVAEGNTRIVVDLADVEVIDSAGIGALITGLKAARRAGGDLRTVAPSAQVSEVAKMTNLTGALPAYPSVETAFQR